MDPDTCWEAAYGVDNNADVERERAGGGRSDARDARRREHRDNMVRGGEQISRSCPDILVSGI